MEWELKGIVNLQARREEFPVETERLASCLRGNFWRDSAFSFSPAGNSLRILLLLLLFLRSILNYAASCLPHQRKEAVLLLAGKRHLIPPHQMSAMLTMKLINAAVKDVGGKYGRDPHQRNHSRH